MLLLMATGTFRLRKKMLFWIAFICTCICQHLQELEQDLLVEETQLPVYFTHETPELMSVYDDISKSVSANSAGSATEGGELVCKAAVFPFFI